MTIKFHELAEELGLTCEVLLARAIAWGLQVEGGVADVDRRTSALIRQLVKAEGARRLRHSPQNQDAGDESPSLDDSWRSWVSGLALDLGVEHASS
jgi:hypothetical protein